MAESWQQRFLREVREMEAALQLLLARRLDDGALKAGLEALAQRPSFRDFTWLWGPALAGRDRVLFRPFILGHFAPSGLTAKGTQHNPWKGPSAEALEDWLATAEREGDAEVFRQLHVWKLSQLPRKEGVRRWQEELLRRFRAAPTRAARHHVLAMMEGPWRLEESTALALWDTDAATARRFLLAHLPWPTGLYDSPGGRDAFWDTLFSRARAAGDEDFAFRLYRRLVREARWRKDVLALCTEVAAPDALVHALDARHPEGFFRDVGDVFLTLVQRRGRDVVPYVLERLSSVFPRWGFLGQKEAKGLPELLALAREKGWEDVWGALLRTSATAERFDTEVRRLVEDTRAPEGELLRRLHAVAGAGGEWNQPGLGLARVLPLTEATALALYARWPHAVRGPFRMHVAPSWHAAYPALAERALAAGDEELVDFLASRAVMQDLTHGRNAKDWQRLVDVLSAHYESLPREGGVFAHRAAATLGRIPAFAIWNLEPLLASNRLARLLLQRSDDFYLEAPEVLRDMLESPQIHVQALAFRLLGRDTPAVRRAAAAQGDLLAATLLRPLHRRTRQLALAAVVNACLHDEATARLLVARMRDAMALPDRRYPKEHLLSALARVLQRWPALRTPLETPLVFRREVAA